MATTCKRCRGTIPDLGDHFCSNAPEIPSYQPWPPPVKNYGVKCDICGSTAIDHTEMQCQLNRIGKK